MLKKKLFLYGFLVFFLFIGLLFPFIDAKSLWIVSSILLLYSLVTGFIIYRLIHPIRQIIDAISPYEEGKDELFPQIILSRTNRKDEFSKLASIFNSLTNRIQKQIENLVRQREETEGILESLGEGIIATDTSGKITFANRTACRMFDVSLHQFMGQSLNGIEGRASELSKKCHDLILHALQTDESVAESWTLRKQSLLYLDLIANPLLHQRGALLLLQDKTSDYKMVEMGKDFIANASHELRTPITIIRGFAETLQDLPDISPHMLGEITEKIVRTCGRLDKLVKSLLTLADIENHSADRFKPVNLLLLVENCKHFLLTAHPNVEISVKTTLDEVLIIADSDLLELAILNLLENAVKYSQSPARIEIEIPTSRDEIQLMIKDRGIGILENDIPHIFTRFYTVDKARSRKSGGAGLGLSIVKTIVEKHKGRVLVDSTLGEGSSFTIVLQSVSRSLFK